ncbi:putative pollen-specific leucine-rich repeat extensin-like protein 3 [Iris pallida]|uniref:Pollen-specific leucine-rich repeat extensin-like protein 3 n=1 Tax=Iris pallida TaxID=29817 RepID=A0AAX6FPN3_IRIPA|nr:putative pollen-specific leucine-rich repeat extensin-like protein 3 [Iris pallida]
MVTLGGRRLQAPGKIGSKRSARSSSTRRPRAQARGGGAAPGPGSSVSSARGGRVYQARVACRGGLARGLRPAALCCQGWRGLRWRSPGFWGKLVV